MERRTKRVRVAVVAALLVLLAMFGCSSIERKLLFYPSHDDATGELTLWKKDGEVIGFARIVPSPRNVWLVMHGNAGQAADREYALPSFADEDSVYILEYPGYGKRKGTPGKDSFNAAAKEAYEFLRATLPNAPVCVAAESIGSGPTSYLGTLDRPPDKIVLIVPFDSLAAVGRDHFPSWMVKMILTHNWDNGAALKNYKGAVEIFAAKHDSIIRSEHAEALAKKIPNAKFHLVEGGHNDWSMDGRVKIRHP